MEQATEKSLTLKKVTVNHDEIDAVELTEQEILTALRQAKKTKLAAIKEKQYWERVNAPIVYPTFKNSQEFGQLILKKIRQTVPGFVIDDQNREIFRLLCLYYSEDPGFEASGEYSLDKGIALIGPVGCGKTTLLRGFAINPHNAYVEVSCRTVAADYSKHGEDSIKYYSALKVVQPNYYWGQSAIGFFFDDLGTEPTTKKHFGNQISVMEEIILNRYDTPGLKKRTQLTTNLSAEQIEEVYGLRVRSRVREMMNWIDFDVEAADRRK